MNVFSILSYIQPTPEMYQRAYNLYNGKLKEACFKYVVLPFWIHLTDLIDEFANFNTFMNFVTGNLIFSLQIPAHFFL